MTPVNITCPTPAAMWGMDPAVVSAVLGAVVGALLTGLATWRSNVRAEKRDKRQRQMEAVAEFITTTDTALATWRATYAALSGGLKDAANIYQAMHWRKDELEALIHAHREAVATLEHGLNVLDLRLTDKSLREMVTVMQKLATSYTARLDEIVSDMERKTDLVDDDGYPAQSTVDRFGNAIMSAFGNDERMPFLTTEPYGKDLDTALGNLTIYARYQLA